MLFRSVSLVLACVAAPLAGSLAAQGTDKPELKPPITLTAADSARYLALGKTYTRWFLAGQADSLAQAIEPDAREKMGGVEGITSMMGTIAERAGVELAAMEDKLTRRKGMIQYWHAGNFSDFTTDQIVIRWLMDERGQIVGAGIGPKANAPPVD